MAAAAITTSTTTTTTTAADYGDQIPLNFMDINYEFAVLLMVVLAIAAVIGTFGNILILVTVATQRQFRPGETIFIINLACCDLAVTLVAVPLSIVTKLVGWRMFEGVPGACKAIGYLCTLSCMGSLVTLGVMSLNRYVTVCHHTLYARIFTTRNCLLFCFSIYVFGFILISLDYAGFGDHAFDYKSFECVFDRMASHDYTVGSFIILVWVPICVTGLCYGKTYWYVRKTRAAISNRRKSVMPSKNKPSDKVSKACRSLVNPSKNSEAMGLNKTQNTGEEIKQTELKDETVKSYQGNLQQIQTSVASQKVSGEGNGKTDNPLLLQVPHEGDSNRREFSILPDTNFDNKKPGEASQKTTAEEEESTSTTALSIGKEESASTTKPSTEEEESTIITNPSTKKEESTSTTKPTTITKPSTEEEESSTITKPSTEKEASTTIMKPSPTVKTPATAAEKARKSAASGQAEMRLARSLFIIYLVFCICWIPYSLIVMSDSGNSFPHELHAFVAAFAHLNSSVNWLVYYHTHMKMRRAFQRVLRCQWHK